MARAKQGDYGGRPCFLGEASSTMRDTRRQQDKCYEALLALQKLRSASQMDCERYIVEVVSSEI